MEPPLERALPIPSLYPQKSNGSFENQLPPLRPPSLSPRSTMLGSQQSPNGMPRTSFIFSRLLSFLGLFNICLCLSDLLIGV
jgi:hypothetical protein